MITLRDKILNDRLVTADSKLELVLQYQDDTGDTRQLELTLEIQGLDAFLVARESAGTATYCLTGAIKLS